MTQVMHAGKQPAYAVLTYTYRFRSTMKPISRAQFLRGDRGGEKPVLRPPWALRESRFAEACDGCGDCVPACPERILKVNGRGLAEIDFSAGGCTFCGDCAVACPTGAISRSGGDPGKAWQLTAGISADCLAMNGTACVRCIESCPEDAILARPALRGRTEMEVARADCTGCGACVASCPVRAIHITRPGSRRGDTKLPTGDRYEPLVHQ